MDAKTVQRLFDQMQAMPINGSIPLPQWMGLPPDTPAEALRDIAVRRWKEHGLTEEEIQNGLREVFGG